MSVIVPKVPHSGLMKSFGTHSPYHGRGWEFGTHLLLYIMWMTMTYALHPSFPPLQIVRPRRADVPGKRAIVLLPSIAMLPSLQITVVIVFTLLPWTFGPLLPMLINATKVSSRRSKR